jgi:hypothetical protein
MIRILKIFIWSVPLLFITGCVPFDKIYSHDFSPGYFKLKSPGKEPENIYIDLKDDSVLVYQFSGKRPLLSDIELTKRVDINKIIPGDYLYNSSLVKASFDFDLSTVPVKFRPEQGDVPSQMNASVNGVLYAGFRKDFFKILTHTSELNETNSFVRQTGFDFGLFAGLGITMVNPTVTMNQTTQEYDGIVFQKGFAVFFTFENMSVGIGLGFDNLIDKNKNIWIYNQKPWIGIVLGVANF